MNQTEDALLAEARARSDKEFDTLTERVAKRHVDAVLFVQQRVSHERWLADMAFHQIAHLEEMIGLKDTLIAALKSNVPGGGEMIRCGANDN